MATSETTSTVGATSGIGDTEPGCDALFGTPIEASGLSTEQCRPACPCDGGWVAPTYDAADVADLRTRVLLEPFAELTQDPYALPAPPLVDAVCGVLLAPDGYRLQTFDDEAAAGAAGAIVSHADGCGVCSTLQDLAVYMANPDLTEPVRACGIEGLSAGDQANLECLLELGFSRPCAQIWLYNTIHTRTECLDVCLETLNDPYHLPDGSLNPCLQCDEDNSGPVFKAVAGRTRRNTGLPNALCRPCDSVAHVVHVYE